MLYSKEKLDKLKHRWTTEKGKKLIKTIKRSHCYLSPTLFREKVKNFPGINDKEVEKGIDLRGAPLAGFDFRVKVADDDNFVEEIAILSNIFFEGANLKHCNFNDGKIHDCYFENTSLEHADFKGTTLNNCHFEESNLSGISLRGAKLIKCNFHNAKIKDITLDTTIVDEKTTFGKTLKSEKSEGQHFASIEYKQIKEMYKNSSLHSISDYYHYKEMVSKRKMKKFYSPNRIFNYIFGDLLCKYGTSFSRVLLWSLLIIFTCAFFLMKNHSLVYLNTPGNTTFLDALYFSIVTFTTLGYGDYHAVGDMRYLAAAEAFMGAALIALFTVIVARNIIRD